MDKGSLETLSSEINSLLIALKHLQKKIENVEEKAKFDIRDFYKDMVSMLRINQEIIAEVVKANDALRLEISKLIPKISDLVEKIDEMLSLVKAAAEGETKEEKEETTTKRLDELISYSRRLVETNQLLLSTLEELKRKFPPTIRKLPRKI